MGTRRSKHNCGRKPRRKDNTAIVCKAIWETPNFKKDEPAAEELLTAPSLSVPRKNPYHEKYRQERLSPAPEKSAAEILGRFRTDSPYRMNQRLNWSQSDLTRLRILADAGIDPSKVASVLGREEKSIAYKARDVGICVPSTWSAYLPKPKYVARPRERRVLLNYPFFIQVDKDKDADLVAVHKLVPKSIPDHMRGDICQDILLAVYEGKVNLATLQRRPDLVKQFVSRWRKENLERGGYGMMSIDPYGDDKRSWEEQVAAKADWDHRQLNDARGNWEAQSMLFTPATQIDEIYMREVHREHLRLVDAGETIGFEEVLRRVEEGERRNINSNLVGDRIRVAKFIEDAGFILMNRLDTNASYYGKHGPRKSQYIVFKIPNSQIPKLEIRVGDHAANRLNTSQFDTYKLGVDGVLRVLEQLAENVEKYDEIHRSHNDFHDVIKETGVHLP